MRRFRRLAVTLVLVAAVSAQQPHNPEAQLQTLLAAQQTALATNDPAQILAASKPAAALALRLVATLDLAAAPDRARDLLLRSAALDPQPSTHIALLAADLRSPGSPHLEPDVAALLAVTGDTAPAHLLLAQTFQAADDLPRTIAQLRRALTLDPNLPALHLALGTAFWQLNQFQYNADSLREFTLAQQADPTAFLPNLDLGTLLSQFHRFAEAAHFLGLAAAADPTSPDPHFQRGLDLYAQADEAAAAPAQAASAVLVADPTGARPELERAVQLTGTDVAHNGYQIRRALTVLARIAALDGRPADAERLAAQAGAIHDALLAQQAAPTLTESTGLIVGAGSTPATPDPNAASPRGAPAGPAPAATAALRAQLLRIAASTLNDAGTALARGHDFAAALPLFREAAAADPTLSPVLRNLGLAALRTGDPVEAKGALTRALALDPADSLARRTLDQIP